MANVTKEELIASNGASLIGWTQEGTGAVTRTVEDRLRDTLSMADFLPVGYMADGSVDYTGEIQAAIDAAIASHRALLVPAGTFGVRGSGLFIADGIRLSGQGAENSCWKNIGGPVLNLTGEHIHVSDIRFWSVAGGATIVQNGLVAQSRFERVHLFQDDPANPVWSNAAHEYVDNRFENCLLQHVTDSMVHAFDLVAVAGLINDNVWRGCRIQNCGTRHFFNLESTSLGPQFSNKFEDLTFEVCLGGGIRIRGANFVIDNCQNWDAGIGAIVNDFYDIDRNVAGTVCAGRIRDCGRWSGTMGAGKYDVSLPGGGGAGIEITDCRAIGSGDSFTVNARHNAIRVSGVIPNVLTITDGDGALTDNAAFGYFDSWGEYRVRGRKVLGERGAAVGDATAGTIVDTVNLLLARLRAHGLIENS
ncbi:hypothetical protein [Sphingomonas sp. IBVSS2]|uniref:hypothetical protein n=1 Tax=Sphingomonas sp. IBVSS2 TaxID=1985172 RepID=UPI001181ACDD|nr:hypothetical protein [Sphingomonas sp. IBVSS2]